MTLNNTKKTERHTLNNDLKIETHRMLTLSTGHLTKKAGKFMTLISQGDTYIDTETIDIEEKSDECGWYIRITNMNAYNKEHRNTTKNACRHYTTPEYTCIHDIVCLAADHNCDIICLDSDGPIIKSLPYYDW